MPLIALNMKSKELWQILTWILFSADILLQARRTLGNVTLTNWLSGSNPCNGWQGVTCTNGNITAL